MGQNVFGRKIGVFAAKGFPTHYMVYETAVQNNKAAVNLPRCNLQIIVGMNKNSNGYMACEIR